MTDLTIYEKVEIDKIDFSELDIAQITTGIKNLQEQAGIITGRALKYVNDNKLFKIDYGTFTNYVEIEFGINRSYAYRLINFVDTYDILSPAGDVSPTSEGQTRFLSKLRTKEEKVEIWKKATKEGKIPTETIVKDLVKEYLDSIKEDINEIKTEGMSPAGDKNATLMLDNDIKTEENLPSPEEKDDLKEIEATLRLKDSTIKGLKQEVDNLQAKLKFKDIILEKNKKDLQEIAKLEKSLNFQIRLNEGYDILVKEFTALYPEKDRDKFAKYCNDTLLKYSSKKINKI